MITDIDNAAKIAEYLLQIKAVKLHHESPFTWSPGWKWPISCDSRKTLSYPNIRPVIRDGFTIPIIDTSRTPDIIAGVAAGGIPMHALLAQPVGLALIYL